MSLKTKLRKLTVASIMSIAVVPTMAQDLIARQAPIDRKNKAVEQMSLKKIAEKENLENPASDLYAEWENKRTHASYVVPDNYKIDLRGFHMPTTHNCISRRSNPPRTPLHSLSASPTRRLSALARGLHGGCHGEAWRR